MTRAGSMLAALSLLLAGCSAGGEGEKKAAKSPPAPKILHFYASPGAVPRGQPSTVCYGVENAAALSLEPPVEVLSPSYNRCFPVTPAETTTYTLTARSASGMRASESFTITVGAAAAPAVASPTLIQFFTASAHKINPGRPVTLCYGVKDAVRVSLSPNVRTITPSEQSCFSMTFDKTTKLTLSASDAEGNRDSETLTITVAP